MICFITCGVGGIAVGAITKSPTAGFAAGVICGVIADNLAYGSEGNGTNHNGGAYHGHAGGMDGSETGFGR